MSDVLHECAMKLPIYLPLNAQPMAAAPKLMSGQFMLYRDWVEEVGYVKAKENPTARAFLQAFGTEVGRDMFGENFWVDIMSRRLRKIAKVNDVIATGIRFPNEVNMIEELGGTTWWVDRGHPGVTYNEHSSETSVNAELFDVLIENYGTLEDLYNEVDIYR